MKTIRFSRNRFKREIETASLTHREEVPDHQLRHLSAEGKEGRETTPPRKAKVGTQ